MSSNVADQSNKRKAAASTSEAPVITSANVVTESALPVSGQPPQKRVRVESTVNLPPQSIQGAATAQSHAHQSLDAQLEAVIGTNAESSIDATGHASATTIPPVHRHIASMIEVRVGLKGQVFEIHRDCLCRHSNSIEAKFINEHRSFADINLPDTSVTVFTMLHDWLYTGRITAGDHCFRAPPRSGSWELNLIRLWLLGETLDMPAVQDAAIHGLSRLIDWDFRTSRLIAVLPYVCDRTKKTSLLRSFIVDSLIWDMSTDDPEEDPEENGRLWNIDRLFHEEALSAMLWAYSRIIKNRKCPKQKPLVDKYLLANQIDSESEDD